MQQQESEIGILKSIRYQNDNGFVIAQFQNTDKAKKQKTFSGLGSMVNPELGIAYKLYGLWETNNLYGAQFKFQFYEVMQPDDTKGIYQYLVRVCKWVGPAVAGRIVDAFREDSLEILKSDPDRVAKEVKGLTAERAREIALNLKENEHIEKALVELERMFAPIAGTRKSLPMEIVKIWGSDAIEKVKANPYLITRIKGIGFPTADKLALSIGFDRKSKAREKAAVWHVLNERMRAQGSVWIPHEELFGGVKKLTSLPGDQGASVLCKEKAVLDQRSMFSIAEYADNESYIANKIAGMVT